VLGFASSIWGFYVASFYGPRRHISTAILGFTLNVAVIVVPIVLAIYGHPSDDDKDGGQYEARASQSATDHYRH
jgi:hypothetical protein